MQYSTEHNLREAGADLDKEEREYDFAADDDSAWEGLSGDVKGDQALESLLDDALKKGANRGNALCQEDVDAIMEQMLEGTTLAEIKNITPEALEVLYSVAYRFYTSGHYQKAALFFQNLILLNHWDKRYLYGMAASLQGLKLYEEALNIYSALYFVDAGNPELCLNAGVCRLAMGDRAEAEDGFKMALEIARGKDEHKAVFDRAEALIAHVHHRKAQIEASGKSEQAQ
ncbi:MAG: SycD/LcrH family type III secretion system chaperone [Gammaproteobacteria bacterium]